MNLRVKIGWKEGETLNLRVKSGCITAISCKAIKGVMNMKHRIKEYVKIWHHRHIGFERLSRCRISLVRLGRCTQEHVYC